MRLSVIVVSDYAGEGADWGDQRAMLAALARQDIAEPFEVLLAEPDGRQVSCPHDLASLCPRTRVLFLPAAGSIALREAAAAQAAGTYVAVFEADSPPAPDWLRLTVALLDREPAAEIVCGRTDYGSGSSLRRVAGLLDRGFQNPGRAGPVGHGSNNAALYRRALLERFPFPHRENPFLAGHLRNRAMEAAGVGIWFLPEARTRHAFHGLRFLADVRRNTGYADARAHRALTGEDGGRGRLATALALSADRLCREAADCRRVGRQYLRWHDWPLALLLLLWVRVYEWPGLLRGLSDAPLGETAYR